MLYEHERCYVLGTDALATVCPRNTNVIVVLAWMPSGPKFGLMGKLKMSSELLTPLDYRNLAWATGPKFGLMGKLKMSSELLTLSVPPTPPETRTCARQSHFLKNATPPPPPPPTLPPKLSKSDRNRCKKSSSSSKKPTVSCATCP